jgi:ATP-dependent DNA helicase PIF1
MTPNDSTKTLKQLKDDAHRKEVWIRFVTTDVLVIDEISMVENLFFERLNAILKEARDCPRPFGGVQVVVTEI